MHKIYINEGLYIYLIIFGCAFILYGVVVFLFFNEKNKRQHVCSRFHYIKPFCITIFKHWPWDMSKSRVQCTHCSSHDSQDGLTAEGQCNEQNTIVQVSLAQGRLGVLKCAAGFPILWLDWHNKNSAINQRHSGVSILICCEERREWGLMRRPPTINPLTVWKTIIAECVNLEGNQKMTKNIK